MLTIVVVCGLTWMVCSAITALLVGRWIEGSTRVVAETWSTGARRYP
ncbi:MAG: hypothetical protein QOG87_3798 [Actinomycetota bacterium]|jgi:hypothetical protein